MGFKFFVIPIHASEEIETELNHFLLTHRVISVNKQFIADGSNSCWAMCIEFISGKNVEATIKYSPLSRNRIDYKSILSPDEFTVYSQLRALRKEIAQIEAVPVYTWFANEQLAQIVQRKCQSKSDLIGIEGVSEVKVEKYLDKILNILHPVTDYHFDVQLFGTTHQSQTHFMQQSALGWECNRLFLNSPINIDLLQIRRADSLHFDGRLNDNFQQNVEFFQAQLTILNPIKAKSSFCFQLGAKAPSTPTGYFP